MAEGPRQRPGRPEGLAPGDEAAPAGLGQDRPEQGQGFALSKLVHLVLRVP